MCLRFVFLLTMRLSRPVRGRRAEAGIHAVRYQDNALAIAEIEKLLTGP
jgi:hypothetical protein